ncbi:hypothetical protein FXF51_27880 [Nonomuraea sp. PA05]|uniref:hypothetical protein n=1 Tax=Nonomuraea sp. PA05 TaxID=2604466 RepID=UPI0011D51531|nr:hypothetical protein [Nonomuraea sp. PA05]TYB61885.1 hypothetical protein FXF51_27880 [Nonomuraea sp. PA05]
MPVTAAEYPRARPLPERDPLVAMAGEEEPPAGEEGEGDGPAGHPLLRWAIGVLANVTVLTGLLVYFGWQRSEIQALELGIDDSVLGMSPTDYVLRSVRQALTLLLLIAIGGLAWLQLDHFLAPRVRDLGTTGREDSTAGQEGEVAGQEGGPAKNAGDADCPSGGHPADSRHRERAGHQRGAVAGLRRRRVLGEAAGQAGGAGAHAGGEEGAARTTGRQVGGEEGVAVGAGGQVRSVDRLVRYSLRFMSWAWLVLPVTFWALGFVGPLLETAFLIFPFSIGVGALLTLYGTHLRSTIPGQSPHTNMPLRYAFTALIVCVSLFYGAGNYATVLGVSLAENLQVNNLAMVRVYSTQRLNLAAGKETTLPGSTGKDDYRYRYTGLRLLLHTSKGYFLVAQDWRPQQGVVIILQESPTIRLEMGG